MSNVTTRKTENVKHMLKHDKRDSRNKRDKSKNVINFNKWDKCSIGGFLLCYFLFVFCFLVIFIFGRGNK